MLLDELLPPDLRTSFLQDHFLKMPYSRAGGARSFCGLLDSGQFFALLEAPEVDGMAARSGVPWSEGRSPRGDEARALFNDGFTVLIRNAERLSPEFRALAEEFETLFRADVDLQIYHTPQSQQGFGWHYDPEDVFIIQLAGVKEYSLRKNTVNPWPLLESLPRNMRYERELMPLLRCRLEPGDWLYIPNGYWHSGRSETDALSLAVGILTPAAIDLLDLLRPVLRESILWRQRLPLVNGDPAQSSAREADWSNLFHELARDFATTLQSPLIFELLKEQRLQPRRRPTPSEE